jgi:ArsR family transcriptional regulator
MIDHRREEAPICTEHEVHSEELLRIRNSMPEIEVMYDLSDFFKVLGDSTRLGILIALDRAPMCVCDIAALLGMTKSAVSHQLKVLRQTDLVRYERRGKNVIYSLADSHVKDIIECALVHINE